jgi:hypothetical protein
MDMCAALINRAVVAQVTGSGDDGERGCGRFTAVTSRRAANCANGASSSKTPVGTRDERTSAWKLQTTYVVVGPRMIGELLLRQDS